jgi:hypothetical protein
MTAIDLSTPTSVSVLVAMFACLWKLAVVYRVTSTGYIYRVKGRWTEIEIRPADSDGKPPTGKP